MDPEQPATPVPSADPWSVESQPALVALEVADDPDAWSEAGFVVAGRGDGPHAAPHITLDGLRIIPVGASAGQGIVRWVFETGADVPDGAPGGAPGATVERALDGLATTCRLPTPQAVTVPDHPNGATALDHIVVMSPDGPRTESALEGFGLTPRRRRPTEMAGSAVVQTFYRTGATVIELVGPIPEDGDASSPEPARFWGLAMTVADIEATCARLGPAISEPRDAVQAGRRIATVRHEALGLTVPLAFLTPRPPRPDRRSSPGPGPDLGPSGDPG